MFDTRAALDAILPKLDRGDAPDSSGPTANGEYWALCPFHNDRTVGNFSAYPSAATPASPAAQPAA